MPITPSSSATPAAIASSTIVNAICADGAIEDVLQRAHLRQRQVRDRRRRSARAHGGSNAERRRCGAHDVAHDRDVRPDERGRRDAGVRRRATSACTAAGSGVASASARIGVFATTPTMVSHDRARRRAPAVAEADALADRILVREERVGERLVDDDDRLARARRRARSMPRPRSTRMPMRLEVAAGNRTEQRRAAGCVPAG